jgi:hypothetical protein
VARDHARIRCSIWGDEDWSPLSTLAKLLYVQLLAQPKLSYAGLLDLAAKRWARAHPDHSVAEIRAALSELHGRRFVVVDHDTEEVLIRTLIRNDGIYKQPQVLAAALRQAFEIESPILRAALATELRRLPVEVCGPGPAIAADALEAGAIEPPEAANPCRGGKRTGKRPAETRNAAQPPAELPEQRAEDAGENPSGDPAPNPAGEASRQAQGVGGTGNGDSSRLPLGESSLGSAARPRAGRRTREDAARLVAEHVPTQPRKVARRLVAEAAALLAEGVPADHVCAGLRQWSRRRVGAGLLPELVGEAMRTTTAPPPSTADDALAAALALARKVAEEDQDDTELGRILRTEPDDRAALAALLGAGVAP